MVFKLLFRYSMIVSFFRYGELLNRRSDLGHFFPRYQQDLGPALKHEISLNAIEYHVIACNAIEYPAIPLNTIEYHQILRNSLQNYQIPLKTIEY